jgi:copper resistance protein D
VIGEAFQTGAIGWVGVAVALRALSYAGQFTAAGLAIFTLLFGARQRPVDRARQGRWAAGAASIGLIAGLGTLAAQVGVLTGDGTLLDAEAWHVVATSRAGAAFALGAAGLGLVAALALRPGWTVPAALGAVLVCASYTLAGHTTSSGGAARSRPRARTGASGPSTGQAAAGGRGSPRRARRGRHRWSTAPPR